MCDIKDFNAELRKINQEEFNIVSWCGVGTTETKHSSMIADLLNPRGPHGCREIPLKLFLKKIGITDVKDFYSTTVTTEKSILSGDRRLDIYLENDDFAVIIENKTESSDHYNQLKDYYDWLQDENKNSKKMLQLAYLTYNDSDKANQPTDDLRHLSYAACIIPWLEEISENNIPEDTKIAIKHYRIFLEKLLELPYVNKRKEIVNWASQHQNIARAKEIVMQNPSAFLLDTVQCVSEGLCKFYCYELLKKFNISHEQISVSEVSLDGCSKTPFRCVCTFSNGNSLEFLPLAPNGRNYGKLYALNKDRRVIYSDDHDKKWSCNFFAWLYGDKDNESPLEWVPKNDISLANCIAVCRDHNN